MAPECQDRCHEADVVSVTDSHDYGSITKEALFEERISVRDSAYEQEFPSLGSIVFRIALVSGLFFVIAQHGAQTTAGQTQPMPDVDMLGKVQRSPSDTAYVFSQRVDHLDPENQETYQQVSTVTGKHCMYAVFIIFLIRH